PVELFKEFKIPFDPNLRWNGFMLRGVDHLAPKGLHAHGLEYTQKIRDLIQEYIRRNGPPPREWLQKLARHVVAGRPGFAKFRAFVGRGAAAVATYYEHNPWRAFEIANRLGLRRGEQLAERFAIQRVAAWARERGLARAARAAIAAGGQVAARRVL